MLILTRKDRKRIEELLERAFEIPPGDVEIPNEIFHVDAVTVREFVRMDLDAILNRKIRWRFWRRNKTCRPIPCPSIKEVHLEVEK